MNEYECRYFWQLINPQKMDIETELKYICKSKGLNYLGFSIGDQVIDLKAEKDGLRGSINFSKEELMYKHLERELRESGSGGYTLTFYGEENKQENG